MRAVLGALLVLLASLAHGQQTVVPAPTHVPEISVLTFAPGNVYWQRFGHNALLLRYPDTGYAKVYNYGVFDFRQKNFFFNFARGRMVYRLEVEPLDWTLEIYAEEGRWVLEQKLNLSEDQRREVRDYLRWNARRRNAEYRYDYFLSNCSTRVRDVVDRATAGELRRQLQARPAQSSFRADALRMMAPVRPLMIGMDWLMGSDTDRPLDVWDRSFLPDVLMDGLRTAQIQQADGLQRPLVAEARWLLPSRAPAAGAQVPMLRAPFLLAGVLLGLALVLLSSRGRRRGARILFGLFTTLIVLISGLAGLVLLAAWTLSDHWAIAANWNLLLANPLILLLLPTAARGLHAGRSWERRLGIVLAAGSVLVLVLHVLGVARQDDLHWILLFVPVQLGLAWTLRQRREGVVDAA
jgi:hypothetical protein